MIKQIIFLGSNVVVEKPKILENRFYKDLGYESYCTILEKQAKRWALTKRGKHIVNKYPVSYTHLTLPTILLV